MYTKNFYGGNGIVGAQVRHAFFSPFIHLLAGVDHQRLRPVCEFKHSNDSAHDENEDE